MFLDLALNLARICKLAGSRAVTAELLFYRRPSVGGERPESPSPHVSSSMGGNVCTTVKICSECADGLPRLLIGTMTRSTPERTDEDCIGFTEF